MWTKKFWQSALERVLKTFAQALAVTLGASGTGLIDMGWKQTLATAGLTALASLLTSLGSSYVGDSTSPSLLTDGK